MSTLPAPRDPRDPRGRDLGRPAELIERFWGNKSPRTKKAYREDLLRMADWKGLKTVDEFARELLSHGPGPANMLLEEFKDWARTKTEPMAPSYVNNHLAAARSLVKFARKGGWIVWAVDVDDLKVEAYRDTAGPGMEGMAKIIRTASEQENRVVAARDTAILTIFATTALRRDEVASLDMQHVDLERGRVFVKRKKKLERVWVTVPRATLDTLRAWLAARGVGPGPLFTSFAIGRRRADSRLAESSIWALVRAHAKASGLNAWPHGFRHAAITTALDVTGGDIRAAQKFAGHENPTVTMRYDDNRKDLAGEVAEQVAAALKKELEK